MSSGNVLIGGQGRRYCAAWGSVADYNPICSRIPPTALQRHIS
jgi:hypothetical protein